MQPSSPVLLVVDGRPEVAAARARTLQEEAGDALTVRAASTIGGALDVARHHGASLVGVVAEHDLVDGVTGLDLLARLRREVPHARRILVTGGNLQRVARDPEYPRVHAAFETRGRFHDVASGIVQDALESERARGRMRAA